MSKQHHDEPGELHFEQIQHQGVQYEDRDLGARGIIVFLVVLGITGIALCLMVWGYFDYHARHMGPATPIAGPQTVNTPSAEEQAPEGRFPKPSLQIDDVSDMNSLKQSEAQRLGSYGYIDQKGGVVHIPIDQAMDQLAKQGLPTRQTPTTKSAPKSNTQQPNAQAPVADFGSGRNTVAGAAGGVRPANN